MNNLNKVQKGFAHMATIMLIIVLAVVVGAGWMVYSRQKDKTNATQSASTPATTEQSTIAKSSDVDSSIKELDSSNVDSDLSTSDIDSDLNAVL